MCLKCKADEGERFDDLMTIVSSFPDIDECSIETEEPVCQQICNNSDGGFTCHCHVGFTLIPGTTQCEGSSCSPNLCKAYTDPCIN